MIFLMCVGFLVSETHFVRLDGIEDGEADHKKRNDKE